MFMHVENKVKSVRDELKELGFSNRQVGVRYRRKLRNGIIYCTIKDLSVNINSICEVVEKYKSLNRCPDTKELYEYGNLFVDVEYCWKAERDAKVTKMYQDLLKEVETALSELTIKTDFIKVRGQEIYLTEHMDYDMPTPWDAEWDGVTFYNPEGITNHIYKGAMQGYI